MFDDHTENFDLNSKIDNVVVDMTRYHLAGENLKFGGTVIKVTHSAVGDSAKAAESFVDVGLYFSPEGASARIGFKILNDSYRGMGRVGYVFIVGQPPVGQFLCTFFWRCSRGTARCAGIPHNGFECWVKADRVLYSEAITAALRDDQFKGVADGRCIPLG